MRTPFILIDQGAYILVLGLLDFSFFKKWASGFGMVVLALFAGNKITGLLSLNKKASIRKQVASEVKKNSSYFVLIA